MIKRYIDTRELAHPKPFEMAIKIIQSLDDKSYLYMLHTKKPIPLIDLAKEHKFSVIAKKDLQKDWHILFSKNIAIDLRTYLASESFGV